MKLTKEAVAKRGVWHSMTKAAEGLRSDGYKFSNDFFRSLWYECRITDIGHSVPTDKPRAGGTIHSPDETRPELQGKRFVFTSAQNNTNVHAAFFDSLETFCMENDAALIVSRFTYNKAGWNNNGGVSKKKSDEDTVLWYDPRIVPYILDEQVKVADGLLFCQVRALAVGLCACWW